MNSSFMAFAVMPALRPAVSDSRYSLERLSPHINHTAHMFETRPQFEQWIPPSLGMEGSHYWHMVVLSSNLPWYLLRYQLRTDDDESITQTTAIAWESTLRSVLETLERDSAVDLSIMTLDYEVGAWSLRRVTEVWLAGPNDKEEAGPLLFRLHGSSQLLSTHLEPVSSPGAQRTLLARFS
jgi:hypothetical protein